MRGSAALLVAALLLTAASAAQEGANPGLGWPVLASHQAPVVAALHQKKIVVLPPELGDEGFVRGMVIFDQPRDTVMTLLTDYPRQNEFQSNLVGFDVISPLDDGVIAEHRIRILFRNLSYRVVHRHDHETHRIFWSLDPQFKNDLRAMDGYWELHVLEAQRTLGVFGTKIIPGGAVPSGFATRVTRLKVPENMERMREWVNEQGGKR